MREEARKEAQEDFNIDMNNILSCLVEFFESYENAHEDDQLDILHYLMEDLYKYKDNILKYHEITMNNII